jgi:hypothetical protein
VRFLYAELAERDSLVSLTYLITHDVRHRVVVHRVPGYPTEAPRVVLYIHHPGIHQADHYVSLKAHRCMIYRHIVAVWVAALWEAEEAAHIYDATFKPVKARYSYLMP